MTLNTEARRDGWAMAVDTAQTMADLRALSERAYADLERARGREAPDAVETAREALALIARKSDEMRRAA